MEDVLQQKQIKKIIGAVKDRNLTLMPAFHRNTNWAELWDDWYLALKENGRPKYTFLTQFCRQYAKSDKQFKFMLYYLGPKLEDLAIVPKDFLFVQPQGWEARRASGGWASEERTKELHRDISRRIHGLDAMRSVGNNVTLHNVTRVEHLAKVVDQEFSYGRLPEELDYKTRVQRLQDYINLHSKLAELQEKAVMLYAKCHGINFDDTNSLATFISASLNLNVGEGKVANRVDEALKQLTEMTLQKAAKFKSPLPAGTDKILDGYAEEIVEAKPKIQ